MKQFVAVHLLLFLSLHPLLAQYDLLSVDVTFDYQNVRIKEALADLTEKYNVKFSYSSSVVNVRERVSAKATKEPLSVGLDRLFATTPIVYSRIGQHIVLKNDMNKLISKNEEKKKPKKEEPPVMEEPIEEGPPAVLVKMEEPPVEEERPMPDSIIALDMPETRPLKKEGRMYPFDQTLLNLEKWRTQAEYTIRPTDDRRLAQVSLFPKMGTNTGSNADMTNNLSVNLLWGESGGVNGLEVGVMANKVNKDMNGMQFAGLGNSVGRNVTGTQVGGIYNKNNGRTRGLQAAGIINITKEVQAAQAAGMINWANGDMAGLQASGLMNRSAGDALGLQVTGLFNVARGKTHAQVSGLFNNAGDVEILQTGLMNVATGHMKGLQVGLINISDTVSGVPIALINIVVRGYNKVEIYGSEILHGNFQLKLGANKFYNIFHIGAQVPPGDGSYIYGIGYGIGTVVGTRTPNHFNFELMAMHINENEGWTNQINEIGQFRFLWNRQLGRSVGFFLGPTANVMVSQVKDSETGEINPSIVPYSLINENPDVDTNVRAWVGVNTGFRF